MKRSFSEVAPSQAAQLIPTMLTLLMNLMVTLMRKLMADHCKEKGVSPMAFGVDTL